MTNVIIISMALIRCKEWKPKKKHTHTSESFSINKYDYYTINTFLFGNNSINILIGCAHRMLNWSQKWSVQTYNAIRIKKKSASICGYGRCVCVVHACTKHEIRLPFVNFYNVFIPLAWLSNQECVVWLRGKQWK